MNENEVGFSHESQPESKTLRSLSVAREALATDDFEDYRKTFFEDSHLGSLTAGSARSERLYTLGLPTLWKVPYKIFSDEEIVSLKERYKHSGLEKDLLAQLLGAVDAAKEVWKSMNKAVLQSSPLYYNETLKYHRGSSLDDETQAYIDLQELEIITSLNEDRERLIHFKEKILDDPASSADEKRAKAILLSKEFADWYIQQEFARKHAMQKIIEAYMNAEKKLQGGLDPE